MLKLTIVRKDDINKLIPITTSYNKKKWHKIAGSIVYSDLNHLFNFSWYVWESSDDRVACVD